MTGKTHLIVGAAAGAALALIFQAEPGEGLLMVAMGAFGGLLPDVDTSNSTISKRVPLIRILFFWIPHRTLTHSTLAMAAVTVLCYHVGMMVYPVAAGYVSHIAADMTTRRGVPLFYPLWNRDLHLLPPGFRLLTGGWIESIFALFITVLAGYLTAQFLGVL